VAIDLHGPWLADVDRLDRAADGIGDYAHACRTVSTVVFSRPTSMVLIRSLLAVAAGDPASEAPYAAGAASRATFC
jgi:hypothetical protein